MTTFTYKGVLYEVEGFGPVDEPGFHYELWDLTAGEGGMVGRIVVPDEGEPSDIELHVDGPVNVPVLLRWMHAVPELRAHGIDPSS